MKAAVGRVARALLVAQRGHRIHPGRDYFGSATFGTA
jgi:hypothetical protein